MSDEIAFHGPSHEVGADPSAPASPCASDPLRDVRALRRWVRIGVYAAIFASEPLYIFVLKMSLEQVLVGLVIGLIIAFTAIEGAFTQIFKLRKRSAYPNELLLELGGVSNLTEAAQQALSVTGRLLGVRASFLALLDTGAVLNLASVSGVDAESAERWLVSGAAEANEAMRLLQPVTAHPANEDDAVPQPRAKASRGEQLVFVPVLALQQPIGVLALANGRNNKDLKDSQLLLGIGVALGLSLESLRQKEELRRGEERLRTVITGAPVILFATDRDGVFTLAEGKGLDALQTVPNNVVGRSAFEVYSQRPEILADFRRALAGEETTSVHKMAGVFLESRLSPKRASDGEVAGVIGIAWDITERMRAQEALEESEERLRTVVSNVPVVLFAIDRDGIFTLSEGRGLDALGLRPGQVVGHSVFDVYRDLPDINANIRRALAGESFTAIVDAGGLVWETNYTPVRDATGEVSGIIGVAADITERKRAEEAVRESESLYRSLVETCPDAVILVGADGTILKLNRPASALFGFEHPEAVVGMPARDFISDEDIERVREDVGQTMITGVLSNIEYTLVKRDGTRVPVELSLSPIVDAAGETKAYIGVARDITGRKRADALLAGEKRVLEMIAAGAPLAGVLEVLTGIVEEQSKGMFCSVLLMDQSGTKLRHGAAPSLPEEYNQAVDGIEIGPIAGSCGTAAHRKQLVVVSDVASDPLWADFKELGLAAGLRACWSLPIFSTRGDVLGTFAMYYSEPRAPEQADIELIERAAHIAGIAIERKQSEEALLKSEGKNLALLNAMPDMMFRIGKDGSFLDFKGEDESELFMRPMEFLGKTMYDTLPDVAPQAMHFVKQALETGETQVFEYQLTINGEPRDYEARIVASGEDEAVAIVRNITERKKAEEALRESEERFRIMADTAPVMVWMSDEGGGCTFFNKPGLDFTGLTPEEALGDGRFKAIHPDDLQRCMDAVGAAVQTQETISLEYRLRRADGEYRWIMDLGVPRFEAGGACTGYIGSAIDITERKRAEVALRESEEKYRELVENTNEVIYTLDAKGIITYVSPIVEQVGGYIPSDIVGKSFTELIHPDDLMPLIESFQRTISGQLEPSEYRLKTNDGEYRWVRSSSRPIYDGELAVGLRGLLVDITERKKAEEALRESEERFRMMADTAPVMVWMSDQRGGCTFFNKPGLDFTGLTLEEALGDGWFQAIHPDDLQRCMDAVGAAVQTQETVSMEYRMRRADGEYRWIMDLGVPRFEAGGALAGYIGSAIDITERKLAEETVTHLAHHDALTGLPNRTLFEDRLRLALAQAQRSGEMLAVMFLDLDHFKVVNDTLGHGGGDDLLQNVAAQLSRIVREGDTVARVGGDEFTLLLPGITRPDDAVEVAERILEALKHPQHLGGHEFRVTTSIGITVYPQDGTDSESLLRNADTAMYRAKERGRDNYQLYTPAMNASVLARLALENDLRHAMERGEFLVHYQPIVEVASGKIAGAEALVRWQHPERGLVAPDEFISFAEESGLILPLGEWVLRNACLQNRAWQDAGYASMRVTVNLSARQLQQENLVATVAQILEESGLAPEHLQLEITEGAVMKNVDFIITMLQQLRLMGVGISVDDFGTGYSSLSYLKRFPIDSVKIDRSFVRDLATDPNDAVIVTTVIAMARSLNLKVIAEGVESEQQLDFLRQQDCDEFQGYLFSRPVAPHSLEKLLSPTNGAKRKVARLKLA